MFISHRDITGLPLNIFIFFKTFATCMHCNLTRTLLHSKLNLQTVETVAFVLSDDALVSVYQL